MKEKRTNNISASGVGFLWAIPGLIAFFIPDISIIAMLAFLPIAFPTELLLTSAISNYGVVSFFAGLTLFLLACIASFLYYRRTKKSIQMKGRGSLAETWIYFFSLTITIHPLVFYIWSDSKQAGDGQFIFGVFETFPISSFLILLIGVGMDFIFSSIKLDPKFLK